MKRTLQLISKNETTSKSGRVQFYQFGIKHLAKTLHILLFVLISTIIICQPTSSENMTTGGEGVEKSRSGNLPMINSEQIWTGYYADFMGPFQAYRYSYSEDSVMLGSDYYFERIESGNEDGSDSFVQGHYRESNGKLYRFSDVDNEDRLILDMSLSLDDTVTVGYYDLDVLKVISVDSVQFEDQIWRKRIVLDCLNSTFDPIGITWIEGIGELISLSPYCALDNFVGKLVCIRNGNGELIYNSVEEKDCWTTTSTKEVDALSVSIYPNPANEELYVEGFGNDVDYIIYGLSGQVFLKSKTVANRILIEQLEKGMYLLELRNEEAKASIRFVKL